MKSNKIKNKKRLWRDWAHSPNFLREILIFGTLFVIFLLSVVVIWKRHSMKDYHSSSKAFSQKVAPLLGQLETSNTPVNESIPEDINVLLNRVKALESQTIEQKKILKDNTIEHQQILQIPQRLIVIEILRSVLEGLIPLETLKIFLHKISEPWAHSLLTTLTPIKSTITYPQLEDLLVLPPPVPLSTWERMKATLKSLIRIRKLDEKGTYKLESIENIQKALKEHDIQRALKFFAMLTPQEKAQLSSWKVLAQERLMLEDSLKNLLLEFTESPKM
ncbi:MAG: hypothetical protein KA112_04445 [Alphaproteobacteria bacterium]|jgi:hypothetical protein|nr:hypothetical protein [Alphaproteobacteria bacterium]